MSSRALSCFFLVLVFMVAAFGQVPAAELSLSGRIADRNGDSVAGAEVVLSSLAVPTRMASVTTDERGQFSALLPPGEYRMSVRAPGFAAWSQKIVVADAQTSPMEIALGVSGLDAIVTVSGAGEYGAVGVTSATRTAMLPRDIPQSLTVIQKQQIVDQSMTSIGDVVRYVPGVTAHQGENNRDQVIIRGQNSSADFYVNGVRDDVQYYRDLYNLDQFEVLKGPNAMEFGRGGGGGIINRVTKVAEPVNFAEITAQAGSFAERRFTADVNRKAGDTFSYRINSVFEDSGSFRDHVDLDRFGINPTASWEPDEKTRLTFSYEFFRDRRTADRGITSFNGRPLEIDPSTYFGDPANSFVRANVNSVSGTLDRQFGRFRLQNRIQYAYYDRGYQNFVPGAVNAAQTMVSMSGYNNSTRRGNVFGQSSLSFVFQTGVVKHLILAGTEIGRQLTNNFRNTAYFNDAVTSIQVPLTDTVFHMPVSFRQSATDANNHLSLGLAAAFVQDQITFSRFFQAIVGVRYDYFGLTYHNNRTGETLVRSDRLASPRAGLIFKPADAVSIYASYSVSYLPSSGDQFSSLTTVTQQVKPEQFTNKEIGLKWALRHDLSFTAAAYRLDRTNTRSTDPNDPTRIIQTGSQRTNGFEAAITGVITSRWTVTGGYSYQNAFISRATASAPAGRQVAEVPHQSVSVWNKYQLERRLSLGIGVIRRSDMFAAIDNTVVLPGYTRFDAAAFYTFNEKWRLQVNAENLLNTRYILNADNNTNISPGSPRSLRVGLIARF